MEHADNTSLSVVIPAFNEAGNIEQTLDVVKKTILPMVVPTEIIVVDDASTDATSEILKQWHNKFPQLKVITHQYNLGHGASVLDGYHAAQNEWVLQLDSDLQFDLKDFARLWQEKDKPLILGVRTKRHDPLMRIIISACLRLLIRLRYRVNIQDANTPFRLIHRDFLVNQLKLTPAQSRLPNVHLAVTAAKSAALKEVPVQHFARTFGKGSLHFKNIVRLIYRSTSELLSTSNACVLWRK